VPAPAIAAQPEPRPADELVAIAGFSTRPPNAQQTAAAAAVIPRRQHTVGPLAREQQLHLAAQRFRAQAAEMRSKPCPSFRTEARDIYASLQARLMPRAKSASGTWPRPPWSITRLELVRSLADDDASRLVRPIPVRWVEST
jgi:hypothetical protein